MVNWPLRPAWIVSRAAVSTSPPGDTRRPMNQKRPALKTRPGIVSHSMWRMWSKSPSPTIAGATLVVSDSGESLSPKNAPEMTAPATTGSGTPMPPPMAMNARPTVAMDVNELPRTREMKAVTRQAIGRKNVGLMNSRP